MLDVTINDAVTMAGGGGALLAGRYRVVRQLGQGGMGSVWLAEDTQLDGKLFAIKMLPSVLVSNKRAYRQLKDEALVAMQLVHPNIVQIRAFEENNGNPFLVMDYIDGQTLDDYLAEKGKISEDEAIKLLKPIAAALDYAHDERVVHRDIKPANVMIRNDGHPFILDFGIAREIQETMTRVTGKLSSGTLLYMSPEQLRGWSPTAAQDIYSFSAMVYECVAGHPPFYRGAVEDQIKNETPESLPASIAIAHSVMAGLEKDPKARPSSCVDVLMSHGRRCPRTWSRQDTIGTDKTIEVEPEPSESIRRNWAWWWIAGSSIVFALLVAGGFLWKVSSSRDIATEPFAVDVPAVTVLPVNVEPAVPSPSEQDHIEEEQDRLKAEAMHLRNEIAAQYCLATNAFNKVSQYRKQPEGFRQHLEKVDLFWESSSSIVLSGNATSEQLANVLVSVSNVVVGIQGEAQWIVENLALRDEILSVRENANAICERFAILEGNHWCTHQGYIDGTNALEVGAERLGKGELPSALESMKGATNLLRTAYSDEQKFISRKKAEAERETRLRNEFNDVRLAADSIRNNVETLGGDHWRSLPSYSDGTNTLATGVRQFNDNDLKSALASIVRATNLLWQAYSEEQDFLKSEVEHIIQSVSRTLPDLAKDYDFDIYTKDIFYIAITSTLKKAQYLLDRGEVAQSKEYACFSQTVRKIPIYYGDRSKCRGKAEKELLSALKALEEADYEQAQRHLGRIEGLYPDDVSKGAKSWLTHHVNGREKFSTNELVTVQGLASVGTSNLVAGTLRAVKLADSNVVNMVWCPPGRFKMGSSRNERNYADNVHDEEVVRGFWIGQFEVSQELWYKVMGSNPSILGAGRSGVFPVNNISRDECLSFLHQLNSQNNTDGFRLPTDVEWEYACRAGTTADFWYGDCGVESMMAYNLFDVRECGSYEPNPWRIYDMHGNIAEWCDSECPRGRLNVAQMIFSSPGYVLRGGSCLSTLDWQCSSAARIRRRTQNRYKAGGLRICFQKVQGVGK